MNHYAPISVLMQPPEGSDPFYPGYRRAPYTTSVTTTSSSEELSQLFQTQMAGVSMLAGTTEQKQSTEVHYPKPKKFDDGAPKRSQMKRSNRYTSYLGTSGVARNFPAGLPTPDVVVDPPMTPSMTPLESGMRPGEKKLVWRHEIPNQEDRTRFYSTYQSEFPEIPPPPPPSFDPSIRTLKYFKLQVEPHEKQRKSYLNENRYILPNPITIVPINPTDSSQVEGTVSVKLVSENCDEFSPVEKEYWLDGMKSREIDHEKKAQFNLKIRETSDGNKFKLFFNAEFTINGESYKQIIVSHPFKVTSNKKKSAAERPRVSGLVPKEGSCMVENEVWIRGKGFNDRTHIGVTFGGQEARISETEENILICYAPKRPDLKADTAVTVSVYNNHPQEGKLNSDRTLVFRYLVGEPEMTKRRRIASEEL